MNLKKIVMSKDGKGAQKSYPSQEEIDALPKKDIGKLDKEGNKIEIPDVSKLERETVGNVIINALINYKPQDKKEIIYTNIAMQAILECESGEIEFKEKIKAFIVKVLYEITFRDKLVEEKPVEVGLYWSWVTSQVLMELGENQDV